MKKVDMFCPRCRRQQRVEKLTEYPAEGIETAFSGRCPDCGAWLFKMVRARKSA